ncbi:hypothetical protein JHD50_10340 [Sulfurimonas sp. MAG313]|nr:hypothetical protein [Sulfurimonas sp. MAG313]MDF1881691.1 hypothetical protein [Sulfurimonas sp. MAG313]
MKLKYLGAMALSVLFISGCSHDEKDRAVQIFTGINPDWFESAPAPVTLDNAQELQVNILNTQTSKASFTYKKIDIPFVLEVLNLKNIFQTINKNLYSSYLKEGLYLNLPCDIHGSKDIEIKKDVESIYFTSMKVSFNTCEEDDLVLNGRLEMLNEGDGLNIKLRSINFLTDLILQRGSTSKTIQKNSHIEFENLEENSNIFTLRQSYAIQEKTKNFGAQDLVYIFEENKNELKYYPISGREYILNGNGYFKVDTSYEASLTPFVVHGNTIEAGGLFKYIGDDGSRLEIEISNTNEITLRADTNADGNFDFNEETKVYTP